VSPPRSDHPSTHLSLLDGVRVHCQIAWEAFFRRYDPVIRRWCVRHRLPPEVCDDLAQELILTLPRRLRSYQREANDGGTNRFHTWLRAVVDHSVIDHFRQRARKTADFATGSGELLQSWPVEELGTELSESHRRDVDEVVARVRGRLQADTWAVYDEVSLRGVAAADAADRYGKSVRAVYSLVYRVNELLQAEYRRLLAPDLVTVLETSDAHLPDPRDPSPTAPWHLA
jgi:RNA polymerase sigma factor (sigma-70 family)